MKKNHDIVEVDCTIKHQTEKAYLVDFGGKKPEWVSKSLSEFSDGVLQLPEWLATEKGMI